MYCNKFSKVIIPYFQTGTTTARTRESETMQGYQVLTVAKKTHENSNELCTYKNNSVILLATY